MNGLIVSYLLSNYCSLTGKAQRRRLRGVKVKGYQLKSGKLKSIQKYFFLNSRALLYKNLLFALFCSIIMWNAVIYYSIYFYLLFIYYSYDLLFSIAFPLITVFIRSIIQFFSLNEIYKIKNLLAKKQKVLTFCLPLSSTLSSII